MPRREKEKETRALVEKTKVKDQVQFQSKRRRRIFQCYNCRKYDHYAKQCQGSQKRKHHASTADVDEDAPPKRSRNDDHTKFFISALAGMVPTTSDTWLIDSGASRHMTGYKENLSDLVEKESHLQVVL